MIQLNTKNLNSNLWDIDHVHKMLHEYKVQCTLFIFIQWLKFKNSFIYYMANRY